jgi:hypothetical protein
MKIIYNSFFPFKGFKAMNFFGLLFVRNDLKSPLTNKTLNHESIHTVQYKEMLWIGFIIWYLIEWFIRLLFCFDCHKAYRNISFEKEAYANQNDCDYLSKRTHFCWIKYLK